MPRCTALSRCRSCSSPAAGAGQALASHSQATYFEGSTDLLNAGHAPARDRAAAAPRRESAAGRALLGRRRARPDSATRPNFEATNPAALQLGRVRRAARRSPAAALAGAADRHLAGAAVGHVQPQSPVRHAPRRRDFEEFMTAVARHYGSEVVDLRDLERAQPPGVPAAAVQLQRHSPPRRASTGACTRPATRGCRPRASRTRRCCSAKRRRSATTASAARRARRC